MKKITSILVTLAFAALFMINFSFFNEEQKETENHNSYIVITSAKAEKLYFINAKKRFLLPGCKMAANYVCIYAV